MQTPHWPQNTGGPSFWHSVAPPQQCPPLEGDSKADIAIVGAGYTGLWAAHYIALAVPHLTIRVIDAEYPGFGASGRNGGWLTGGFAWSHDRYLAQSDAAGVRAMVTAMGGTVAEIISKARAHKFDADIHETDELLVALTAAQLARLRAEATHRLHWGESSVHMIDAAQTQSRIAIPGAKGALVIPGVARIQPWKLVQGIARLVQSQGVHIHGKTRAITITPGRITTPNGTITAPIILRATEGYTPDIKAHHRDWLPLNSAQIITAPLSQEIWSKIGWQHSEIMGDFCHIYSYCQRTADDRIAVGGRGIPYLYGSKTDRAGVPDDTTIHRLIARLNRLFPATIGTPIDHAWCGTLGVPRDWCATVGFDPATGLGHAGGYVGVGVSTSNLAGRTLADLALGLDTPLTRLPWVNRTLRRWEPEPLRWLGLRGAYTLLAAADRHEAHSPGPSPLVSFAHWMSGR